MELAEILRDQHLDSRSQPKFIQTNKDLQLTVTEEVQLGEEDQFNWKFKHNNNIARLFDSKPLIFPEFKDRVEFFPNNLSLVVKNAQLSDSGTYTAVVSGNTDVTHAEYDVKVQAPVPPVRLTLDSVFDSRESCNFTASCSTEGSPSISRYFNIVNRTLVDIAPSDLASFLHLYQSGESIICDQSNHVSRSSDTKPIREVCPLFGVDDDERGGAAHMVGGISGGVIGLIVAGVFGGIVLITGFLSFWKRRKRQRENALNIDKLFKI